MSVLFAVTKFRFKWCLATRQSSATIMFLAMNFVAENLINIASKKNHDYNMVADIYSVVYK